MKILVAPFAYKGTISPLRLSRAIAQGVKNVASDIQCQLMPLADGGDGTIESLHLCLGGQLEQIKVAGPLDKSVQATWLRLDHTAVIELAQTSGLALIDPRNLDALRAHTTGLGELIKHCVSQNIGHLVLGLGGSASTDGGGGALAALGAEFFDARGNRLGVGGGALNQLDTIDLTGINKLNWLGKIDLALDVGSPLLGPNGAAYVFGPQKGADAEAIAMLETGLTRFADLLEALVGQKLRDLPGAGAAGGTAFGLTAGLNAKLNSGFALIAEMLSLANKIEDCDLVITAEGCLDRQSFLGKGIGELAAICNKNKRPLWVVPACASPELDWQKLGIDRFICASNGRALAQEIDVVTATERLFN